MSKPLISFCIPTYNRANYLKNCIESIISYPFDDIEVVISDNGSTDNTQGILKSYPDKRIRYYANETNIGARLNVRKVLDYANGDYLFYLTDDDSLVPGAVHEIKDFIGKSNYSVFRTDQIKYLEKNRKAIYISNASGANANKPLTVVEKVDIIIHSSTLSGLCFKKNDFDFAFYDNNIDLWYPSTLIAGCLSHNMGYLAKPIIIHTWENEIFWGISDRSRELIASQVEGYIKLHEKIEPQLYSKLIKKYMTIKRQTFNGFMDLLPWSEKILFIPKILLLRNLKKVTRSLAFVLRRK